MEYYYRNDFSLVKSYIEYNQGKDIKRFLIKNYKTKNYNYKAFLNLLKEEFDKGSYFDLYKFERRLWGSIEKNAYGDFLDKLIIQEKTLESEYFITPQEYNEYLKQRGDK